MTIPLRTLTTMTMLLAVAAMAQAGEITVTLDTSVLIGSTAGLFAIGFQLADGSLTGDGNNAVVVGNFQFGGGMTIPQLCEVSAQGGATGDLSSSIALTDLGIFSYCFQPFLPGSTLSFNVSYTNNLDPAGLPDEFVMVILDKNLRPIPTTGGVALLQIDFNSASPTVQTFAGDPTQPESANGGFGIAISAPVVSGTAPVAPLLVLPSNGATGASLTPALSWSAAAGATSYDVYFGTGGTPPFVTNTTVTSYSPAPLTPGTTYSWQIVARSASGSATSAIWSFTTVVPLQFYPTAPCRLVDTRGAAAGFNGIPPFSGPSIPSEETITIPVQSVAEASANAMPAPCGVIPSTAQAYSFNLTMVPAAGGAVDYVSLWPAGSAQPFVSTLDDPQGLIVSNAAIVPAGSPSGGISVYNAGPSATDVILDMDGYFAPPGAGGLEFYPVTPCRLADTRGEAAGFNGIAPFSGPPIPPAGKATIPVQSAAEATADTEPAPCGVIPSGAQAYSFNLTVVPTAAGSGVDYVSLWPAGLAQPFVSTLDDPQGLIVSNAAIVPAGTPSGGVSVYNAGPATTDVVIDMNGYFAASTFFAVLPGGAVPAGGYAGRPGWI